VTVNSDLRPLKLT